MSDEETRPTRRGGVCPVRSRPTPKMMMGEHGDFDPRHEGRLSIFISNSQLPVLWMCDHCRAVFVPDDEDEHT